MKTLRTSEASFEKKFQKILEGSSEIPAEVETTVRSILARVRRQGDKALRLYTQKFDKHSPRSLEVTRGEIEAAYRQIKKEDLISLKKAVQRIKQFHQRQKKCLSGSWIHQAEDIKVGEQVRPLSRVGIYVPGGLAAYPSTVLMNAIPAKVAGVSEIIMVSPWSKGQVNPHTLVAADLVGVTKIFKIGGAQAIAALAYGTETVPAVDKITGPGNIFVATAKRLVFGQVGIDMIAGPTEIVVIADSSARPDVVASDLLSQAEHDPQAVSILIALSETFSRTVTRSLRRQLSMLKRSITIEQSLKSKGLVILVRNLSQAVSLSNQIGPEHLSLQIKQPSRILASIQNAGAIFLGSESPVAFGDYLAGPNHVLPTSRTARFSSPLGVMDFLKRSSVIEVMPTGLKKWGNDVVRLANLEGLTAHAASVEIRMK